MLLCQITDLHVTRPGALACGRVDTALALRRAIAAINHLTPRPDAVIATGDLIDTAHPSEYEVLRECLAELTMPLYLVVGNHDHREALRDAFPEHVYLRTGYEFLQYRVDLGPTTVLALDTQDPPGASGHLCESRLSWLDAQLHACAGRPTIIAMHHPPFETGIEFMDGYGLSSAGREGFARVTSRHGHIERVICGHVHRPIHTRFAGTIASVCPSPAHQVALDLRDGGPSAWVLDPPAFQLHRFTPSTGLVSHLAFVDDAGGAHPFYDASGALID